jgi:hypothetical protein
MGLSWLAPLRVARTTRLSLGWKEKSPHSALRSASGLQPSFSAYISAKLSTLRQRQAEG